MTRILGIDPGSRVTGYAVVEREGARTRYLGSGCIRAGQGAMPDRLRIIYEGVRDLIESHAPQEFAIEQVFMHRNAASALKLGHARGAALVAAVMASLPVYEYTPAQIKQAVVGKGNADKAQIQHMVGLLLNLSKQPGEDAADALAVALCHSHTCQTLDRIPQARRSRGGRVS